MILRRSIEAASILLLEKAIGGGVVVVHNKGFPAGRRYLGNSTAL